jgi:carbonic anhydrase
MTVVEMLIERNADGAAGVHRALPNLPRLNLCIVTCPDPRVDPAHVFGLEPGDAAVVRAAAGRVSPIVIQQLAFLSATGADLGQQPGSVELLLMTHTECGIEKFASEERRPALAAFLGCPEDELDSRSVTDPRAAVRGDLDLLAGNPMIPSSIAASGVVYDVATGRVELVERRAPLRPS